MVEVEAARPQRIGARRRRATPDGLLGARPGERGDDLKWCGASPLYTFLQRRPRRRGELLRYEQWNIDPASVVSFAALAFGRGEAAPPGEGGA